ncbi:MAG: hypothetical protein IJ106_08075 [Parasporobacterium sp.]|nr:hypothetical protein [Parasporobacterium sp.]
MQIWTTYHEEELGNTLLTLSKAPIKYAILITTKNGDVIPADQYDVAASHGKNEQIHAFIRIPKIFHEDGELYYDLEHTQLYLADIKELTVCDKWVSESESPESVLKPGMKVHVKRMDTEQVYEGELTIVTFLDIVIKTAEEEVSVPVSKIRSMIIL